MVSDDYMTPETNPVFCHDRYAHYLGVELLEVGEGSARASLAIAEHHLNAVGTVHGGAIFGLADLAFAVACNSRGALAVALNVSISYVKAVRNGTLYATAQETTLGSRIATYTIDVTDEAGDVIALFQGMAYRRQERSVSG